MYECPNGSAVRKENPLLDKVKESLGIKTDTDLAKKLGYERAKIAKMRMGHIGSDRFIVRAYLLTGISIEDLIELGRMEDNYKQFKSKP